VSKLKRHLSVANVLSCIALFVALGGTAFAAVKLNAGQVRAVNIARQAVTNPKIKQQAVTSGKIKNGTVNALDIGAGQVISEKIATGSVTGKKIGKKAVSPRTLAEEAVTTGKLGNEAVVASKISKALYEQLVRNVAYESKQSASDSEPNKTVTANCPSGKEAIGGGVRLEGELAEVSVTGSYPFSTGNSRTGWTAIAHETGPGQIGNWSVVAFVVCAEL
jgi:trimeric autotransporter adhesin